MIYFLLLALAESLCSFDCLLLGMNGVCDKECNLKGCVYDNSECGDCSIGCLTEMLGDGICNLECFVDVCDYDVFDCYGGCNDKCTSSMIGDGNCDADCLTEACSFDGDDCLEQCAPGCYDFMIEDWMCESECMTESCGYDIADCNTTVWVTSGANGDGSEAFPYGTIQEALYSIFEGYVNIIVSEGVYYIDETIFLFAQAAVVITGVGNVEVRFLSPNYGIFFYDFALVSVNNITFDGSELFMQGCNEDLCRFIQNWYCADTCVNDFGKEIQSGTIYSIDYYEFCTNSSLLSIFTLENVGKGVFKDITIKNTEFLSNLVKSTGSSLEVSNVFVTHSVVYGSVIHAQSEETVKYKEFQTTNMANIEFYLALWPLTVNVTYVELYDINRISLPFTNPCRIFDYPSAVKTIGIDSVYISDIYFDFLGKSNVVGSDFGLVEIESGTNFHVQNVYSSHLQMQSGSVVFINIFPNFFTVDKSKNFIQNINIENSYIVGGVVRVKTRFTGNELQVTDIQAEKISLNNAAIANLTGVIFSSDIITLKNLLSGKKKEIGECRKTFFQKVTAQDVQLTGPLISFSDFTKLEFSEFYFSDISNQKERFYIDEAFAYFNDKKFFDEQAKLPASLFWIIKSKQNTIDSGSISEVDLDSFIFLLEELQGEYVIGKVIAEKSTTLGFVYLFNNVKSNCYLNELEVYQCEFEGPALEISQNFYVEVSGMVVEGITTAGVSSSSEKILLKSSIFKNNVSVQSMVVLKAQSVNSVATIDGVQFLNNFAPVAADIYIDPILVENNFEVFILNSLFSLSQSALSQSLKVSPNNAIGSILFENVTIHNIAPDDYNGIMNFQLAQGQVTFKDSVFKNIKQGKENTFSNVIFYRNMAEQQISFINCQIETIEIYVFILFDSLTMQQNVLFQNLTYDTNKSPLFNSYNTNINISDSTFSNNLHSKSLIGVKDSSSLILYSSTFSNNSPQNQNPLIDIINSQSNSIYNCAFLSNVYENGVMISAKYSNLEISELVTTGNTANGIFELYIVDAQIKSLQAINDNCMRYMEVKISDVALKNNSFANIDRFLLVEYSNATLENIKIQNTNDLIFSCLDSNFTVNSISISDSIGKIAIDTCKVQIDSSSFQNYQGTASIVSSDLLIGNVLFNHSKGLQIDSSTVKLKELNSISCDSALVLNNSLVSIDNSNFLLNSNTAIRSSYSTLQVNSSYFEENSGENGGGIYIAYSDLKLEKSCFFGNKADKGGGIFVELSNLQYDEFTSENNTAGYGDNIAGIPAYLVEYFNNEVFVSGKPVENLTFAITDPYNQVILTDNSSYLTISISNSSGFIQGSSKIIATQGLFRLEDLQFFTMPGEYADFTITSSLSPEISLNFSLYFRECLAGEVQLSDNSCKTCENNTYSLSTNDSYCNSCPSSAICFGSNKIYPNLGYWSDPAYPANLYPCMNINACLKGSDSSENNCAYSYNGTLCANCISGYKLKGSYICNKCPEYWVSVAIVATGSLVILALIVFLVYSNIKSVDKQKSDIALLLKVFVNYCQTIMLFSQIELKWPVSILHLFNFSNMVGDSSNQMLTLSCDTVIQSETTSISETIIITFLPCLLGFIAFVIWGIVSIRKKSIRYLKVHFVSTLVVILFLMQTSVSNTLLSLISCKKINGKYYNTKDFSLECYTSKHLEILYEIAIPGIFLWCFIIPIGVFFFMFKNRKNLNERDTKIKFKTLFAGFSERLFFWEFLIFARKFLIRLIAILLISSGVSIQGLGIMVVLVLALVAHLMYLPYEKKEINSLEFFCIITLCMYAAGGILFDSQISDFSKEIIGWLLFALNFLFITSWAKHFFRAIYEALAKSNLFAKLLARLKRKNPRKVANYFSDAVENKAVDQDSRLADHSVNHLLFPENPNNSCEVSDDSNLSYISEDIVQRPNAWTVRFQSD